MTRVVCIGECMVELRAIDSDTLRRSYAGDVYNTAVYLKRSLAQARVQFLTATGDDAMSHAMRQAWQAEGIDAELAYTVAGGTPGLYLIETDAGGERRFHYWRSQSAARAWWRLLSERQGAGVWGADLVYVSGIALAILPEAERRDALLWLKSLRGQVGAVAFDPNVRPTLWQDPAAAAATLRPALSACDIALPSTEDLAWLFEVREPERQIEMLRELGVGEIALTLGAGGAIVAGADDHLYIASPPPARVVDTSGAGDAFNGAYLAARLRGGSPPEAARAGLALATRVVAEPGAIIREPAQ